MKYGEDGSLPEHSDQYYDYTRDMEWNQWDPKVSKCKEISEDVLDGWVIGDNYIAHTLKEKNKVPPKEQGEIKQDQIECKAVTEAVLSQETIRSKKG